jgi:hypothetical protein
MPAVAPASAVITAAVVAPIGPSVALISVAIVSTTIVSATHIAARDVGVAARIVAAVTVIPTVVPRARSDEDAVSKPLRPVVAIGSARVRIVSVIAVRAHRRAIDDGGSIGPNANANGNLRVRMRSRHEQDRE